jgi:hypothetical protein
MEEHTTSQADRLVPVSSNALIDSVLKTIDAKVQQLKTNGLTLGDQEILRRHRLSFVWDDSNEAPAGKGSTIWRKARARRAYTTIQNTSEHLFLAVILAIPPTECAKTSFDGVLDNLVHLQNYEPYYLNLGPAAKSFFESTAAEQGYSGSRGYLSFMKTLFPQGQ